MVWGTVNEIGCGIATYLDYDDNSNKVFTVNIKDKRINIYFSLKDMQILPKK